ncbi:ABC transporter ATP-binding protein [Murimonas intestini]|uniref:ABC-2 type transport system ATP-binding protein n=1 Tax=Murimonas intestini TaxID=1337051 RepID=A0AB73TA52_9FIRM|nr:ABC transporter ATP-binding protein [Murimonas intestini]MCR1839210.1 ABC transporter ATP-binding protein [Murimonas intestini]MCR1864506.1 ABC transporter ATP-binding protein [Murimonas intestini]MCR1882116.1 ABC transporter ATP-binding protein [Murimonas intestini]
MNVIDIKNLTKSYGKSRGIEDVTFSIEKGEIFGFIGPNGAGKSTTIRLLLSLIYPDNGHATIENMDCFKDSKNIKKILGYVPSEVNYYDDMKVIDLFDYSSRFYKKDCSDRSLVLSKRLGLDITKKINALSYGNKKKVAIIQALLHCPKVLIFDEPTSGLDPLIQNEFFEILKEEKKRGITILFSSHVLNEVQKVCDRVAIIKEGKILTIEQIESLRKNQFRQVEISFKKTNTHTSYENMAVKILCENENTISFLHAGNIHDLLSALEKDNNLENVSITEPSLEDVFLHYYVEGSEDK